MGIRLHPGNGMGRNGNERMGMGMTLQPIKSKQIYLRRISGMKHQEQSEYVDRTQRQHETALLTRALKIKTTLQHKVKFGNSVLKTGCSRRSSLKI